MLVWLHSFPPPGADAVISVLFYQSLGWVWDCCACQNIRVVVSATRDCQPFENGFPNAKESVTVSPAFSRLFSFNVVLAYTCLIREGRGEGYKVTLDWNHDENRFPRFCPRGGAKTPISSHSPWRKRESRLV